MTEHNRRNDGVSKLAGYRPGFRAYLNAARSVVSDVLNNIPFASVEVNQGPNTGEALFDASDTDDLAALLDGWYLVSGKAVMDMTGMGAVSAVKKGGLYIYMNHASDDSKPVADVLGLLADDTAYTLSASGLIYMAAGDTISMQVSQNSGITVPLGITGYDRTLISAVYLGN